MQRANDSAGTFRLSRRALLRGAAPALAASCAAQRAPWTRYDMRAVHMAVPWTVLLYSRSEAAAARACDAAMQEVAQIDRIASDYREDSELTQLGRASDAHDHTRRELSPELARLLRCALRWAERSDGAFDPTIGPVVQLWRRARRRGATPSPAAVERARARVGWRACTIDADDTITIARRGVRFDLGGIAKGYALDRALDALRAHGIRAALIDAGGDLVCGAPPPERSGAWRVHIEALPGARGVTDSEGRSLEIADAGVATSGASHQFVEVDGVHHSHIVDTASGRAVRGKKQVTVLAKDATSADALATACNVLPVDDALRLVERLGHAHARIESLDAEEALRVRYSSEFPRAARD